MSWIQCDEGCGWVSECKLKDMAAWHNKPCPQCGKGVIINDAELRGVDTLLKLIELGVLDEAGDKPALVTLEIDTSVLRNK